MRPGQRGTLFERIGLRVLEHLEHHGAAAVQPSADGEAGLACGRVVLVTSTNAREGKSFVAQGLATALAELQDGDVICVDAAFGRPPADADNISRRGASGLSEIMTLGSLQGLAPAGAGTERLWRLGRGVLAQPALLQRPDAVAKALMALRAGFALIVLDAPSLAGCGALLAQADACVMVVDSRHTERGEARRALMESRLGPERLAGLVLNHRPVPCRAGSAEGRAGRLTRRSLACRRAPAPAHVRAVRRRAMKKPGARERAGFVGERSGARRFSGARRRRR